jgi:hypothetical protein
MKAQQSQQARGQGAGSFLQKCDNAEATVFHHLSTLNHMKTKYLKTNWLIILLAIVLVAIGSAAATTYLNLQRRIHADEAFAATLDRIYQGQKLSVVLKAMQDGDAGTAAQRLDLLLCENILIINSELASAGDRERAYVKDAFMKIARLRPKNPDTATGGAQELSNDQIEAQKILAQACVEITRAN